MYDVPEYGALTFAGLQVCEIDLNIFVLILIDF